MPKQKNTYKPFTDLRAQVALMDVGAKAMTKKLAKMILKNVAHNIESSLLREVDAVAAPANDLDEVVLNVTAFADAVTAKLTEVSEATLTQYVWNGDPYLSPNDRIGMPVRQPDVGPEAPPAAAKGTPPPFIAPIFTKDPVAPPFIPPIPVPSLIAIAPSTTTASSDPAPSARAATATGATNADTTMNPPTTSSPAPGRPTSSAPPFVPPHAALAPASYSEAYVTSLTPMPQDGENDSDAAIRVLREDEALETGVMAVIAQHTPKSHSEAIGFSELQQRAGMHGAFFRLGLELLCLEGFVKKANPRSGLDINNFWMPEPDGNISVDSRNFYETLMAWPRQRGAVARASVLPSSPRLPFPPAISDAAKHWNSPINGAAPAAAGSV